ncbi:MAG: hypothetical protein C0501_08845 [Isosphaera sp.]|nr:hypothetical protein [Isosphaera sp.]
MLRILSLAAAAVALCAAPAGAKRIAPLPGLVEKVARSEAVVVGKVTAVEKDRVMLPQYPGAKDKVAHAVAVVTVEKGLLGAGAAKEFKVAFVPPPKPDPNVPVRPVRGRGPVDLPVGLEGVFFLTAHPGGTYHAVEPDLPPLDAKAENYKGQVEVVGKAAAAVADPMAALKAGKPEDRFLAAAALVIRYRTVPNGVETEVVKVPADESRLILKGLAEGDWSRYDPNGANGSQTFYRLGLTAADGWVQPAVSNPAGAPVDFTAILKDAFGKWVDGPGKDYRVNKVVPKAPKK